ncbi:MAG: DMT family transporter [Bacteroidales bacterium]|nr:DMT family transporter [Bacteroidales bacterium]
MGGVLLPPLLFLSIDSNMILIEKYKHITGAVVCAIVAGIVGGVATPISKIVLGSNISTESLSMTKLAATAIVLWIAGLFAPRINTDRHLLKNLLGIGIGGVFVGTLLFYIGLNLSFPIEAGIINSYSPLWCIVVATLWAKKGLYKKQGEGIAIATVGLMVTIIFFGEWEHDIVHIIGNLLVMVSMITTATYTFALEKLSSGLQLIHIYKWAYTFATIVAIAVHIAFNGIAMPALHTDTLLVVYIIYVCAVATPLSLVLHFVAKKRLTTKTLNTYSYIQPLVGMIVAYNIGFNTLTIFDPIAVVIIVGGYLLATRKIA